MAIRPRGKGLQIDVTFTGADGKKVRHKEAFYGPMAEARAREATIRADLEGGRDPKAVHRLAEEKAQAANTKLTLAVALDDCFKWQWVGTPSEKTVQSTMKLARDFFGGGTLMEDITTIEINRYIKHLRDARLKPSTVNKRLHPVSFAFNHFVQSGQLESAPHFTRSKERGNERTRQVTDKERIELIRIFEEDYDGLVADKEGAPSGWDWRDFFVFLMDTAVRPSEARRIRPQDVRGSTVAVLFTKTDNPRHLPLTNRAQEAIERQQEKRPGEKPFGWTEGCFGKAFDVARSQMGLMGDKEFTTYILRHDCATRLYRATRDLLLVKNWLGHKSTTMTERYAKLFPDELNKGRDALEAILQDDERLAA